MRVKHIHTKLFESNGSQMHSTMLNDSNKSQMHSTILIESNESQTKLIESNES
jgi:hypothetical protein